MPTTEHWRVRTIGMGITFCWSALVESHLPTAPVHAMEDTEVRGIIVGR